MRRGEEGPACSLPASFPKQEGQQHLQTGRKSCSFALLTQEGRGAT